MIIDFHTHRPTAEGVITPRSFGIHPWFVDEVHADSFEEFVVCYKDRFDDAEIIGECGLDTVRGVSWDRQLQLFTWQLRIAEQDRKTIVIHCVQSFNELMEIRKDYHKTTWVVHGFTGSAELRSQLLRQGIWVSYGAALLNPKRVKVRESLKSSYEAFLLETDDSGEDIKDIYNVAATITGQNLNDIEDTIKRNYQSLIINDELKIEN